MDLLTFEATEGGEAPASADVEEVCNYVDALHFARSQLADPQGPPLSMRLLDATHARLLRGGRGASKLPGEVRRSQNWIGGSRPGNAAFVPAPPHRLGEALSELERYVHTDGEGLHPLVRAGLLHVQFETIHPYLDGNGRIGRLLVSLPPPRRRSPRRRSSSRSWPAIGRGCSRTRTRPSSPSGSSSSSRATRC